MYSGVLIDQFQTLIRITITLLEYYDVHAYYDIVDLNSRQINDVFLLNKHLYNRSFSEIM